MRKRPAQPDNPNASAARPQGRGTYFDHFARSVGRRSGRSSAFTLALFIVLVWLVTGPLFHFSDTWQLVINTATTVITFLMVFVVQHTQNRDTESLQVKLDELIRAVKKADNALLDLEDLEEDELAELHEKYLNLAKLAREETLRRQSLRIKKRR